MAESRTVVYVSNAESKTISIFELDAGRGSLRPVDTADVPGTDEPSPISMPLAVSPDRRFLYAALRSAPYPVASFAIDARSGCLTHLATALLPDAMPYILTDGTGRYLFSASYHGAKLAVSAIGPDGAVHGPALQIVPTPPKAHCVVIDASNRFLYAASLGGDVVLQQTFDVASGRMTPNDPPVLNVRPGAGPRHLVFHPNGRFVYLINELDATIDACAVDPRSGTLRNVQMVAMLPPDYPEKPSAADIHVTPDGRFLYASERASNTIAGFSIEAETGALSPIGSVETEPAPRGFNIDPSGRLLLAVGQTSHKMSLYSIDAQSGRLTKIGQCPMGTNPNWVEIIDLPRTVGA